MGRAKKTNSSSFSASGAISWLFGAGKPILIVGAIVVVCGGGFYMAWQKMKPQILVSPEYRVGPENCEITPPPPWVHRDLRAEVFRDPRLDGCLSVLDDDLVDRIKDAFAQNAWVAKVNRVSKHFPASVKVDLAYRKPVCMVEVPGGALAVDAEGVVLPSEDFTPLEAKTRFPLLLGVDRKPPGMFGGRWGDARVIGGAEIASLLGDVWEAYQLERIESMETDPAAAQAVSPPDGIPQRSEPFFALFTRAHTRILWGHAPGASYLGEIPANEKLARLKRYFDDHDSLDGPNHKAQELDVRTLRTPSR